MPAVPKRILLIPILAFVVASSHCALLGKRNARSPLARLVRLYEEGRYFELRDAVALMDWNPSVEMEFFHGAVDAAFNRLGSAAAHLRRYTREWESRPVRPLDKEAWLLLSDVFRREGLYGKAAEALREVDSRFGTAFDQGEKRSLGDQIAFWSLVADIPPQTVSVEEDTTIRMEKRIFPVLIEGRAVPFGYDTGSSLSILYRSAAEDLGLPILPGTARIQTSTGAWIDGQVTVAREVRLGSVRVTNAIFLILPDEMFAAPHPGFGGGRKGLLGAPILVGLGEFTETKDGRLIIPASPPVHRLENMCLSGFLPIVDVDYRYARLPFFLDTGAAATTLNPPFVHRYPGETRSRSRARKTTLSGVGSRRPVTFHILREFAFKAGGKRLALRHIAAHTRVTNSNTGRFFGTLGLDILDECSRMTVNSVSMTFILE